MGLPELERQVLDTVMPLGTTGSSQRWEVRFGRPKADHPLVVGDRDEQRSVSVAVAHERVDLEVRSGPIVGVETMAVVHDSLEHAGGQDPHDDMMAHRDPARPSR